MRRILPLVCLAFVLIPGCNCAPPAVSDPDGGSVVADPDDAGTLADAGPDDAGPDLMALSGSVMLQREDGRTQLVDLASGEASYPVANAPFMGAVTAFEGELYGFTKVGTGGFEDGRIARIDLDSGEVELLSSTVGVPTELLVKTGEATTVYGSTGYDLAMGPLGYDDTLEIPAEEWNASAAVYLEDGTLWTSSTLGTGVYLSASGARVSSEHCGGLSPYAGTNDLLCARVDGSGIVKLNRLDGSTSPLDGSAANGFRSALALEDGGYIAVGSDCEVVASRELPDLSGVCPYGFAEIEGTLFVGLRYGGILEIAPDGEVSVRATASMHGTGIASANGHSAIVGSWWQRGGLVLKQGARPRYVGPIELGHGIALMDDGALWAVQDEGIQRAGPDELTLTSLHERDDLDRVARVAGYLYFSVESGGLLRLLADDGPDYALSEFADVNARRIAGCSERLLVQEEGTNALLAYASDGTSSVIDAPLEELQALGCVDDQIVLAFDDGSVVGRRLADMDGEWRDIAVLEGADIEHIAGWSASE